MTNRWQLTGRRAPVTGATKGIGWAVADELLALGAEVLIVARNADKVADWAARGLPTSGLAADGSTVDGLTAVQAGWQGLDILVNNVGTNIHKEFTDYTTAEYERLFQVNLFSVIEMCRAAYPLLRATSQASVVTIGSVAGRFDVGTGACYSMTKAAEEQLAQPGFMSKLVARTPLGRVGEAEE